jgi:hypothetical protein
VRHEAYDILLGLNLATIACAGRIPLENPGPPSGFSGAVRLVAHADVIHQGEKVILRWNAPNMPEVTLEQAVDPMEDIRAKFEMIGTFPPAGTVELYPCQSVTYIVSCGTPEISCSSSAVHVVVK